MILFVIIKSMSEFIIKYLLRVAHIGSIIAISHKTFSDFQSGIISTENSGLYAILGIIAMASGKK